MGGGASTARRAAARVSDAATALARSASARCTSAETRSSADASVSWSSWISARPAELSAKLLAPPQPSLAETRDAQRRTRGQEK
jgi:hypothetical protein